MASDFLARIKLALDGKEKVVAGLKDTQSAVNRLQKTKVTTLYDPQGVSTGKQVEETFSNVAAKAPKAAKGMGDFARAINRAAIVAPVWLALRSAMMGVVSIISEQVKFLKDLEDAMARIKIVGKGTEEEYNTLRTTLVGLSMTYGVVASEALKAAVLFAQQGKTVKEVIELTRVAMIGSQVLGSDIVTTVDNMTAAVQAFNIPVEDSISIIDKWINVEKQFAVTGKDLADATKVSGATANQMGVSINAFLGDVTAVIEVTRKSGSEAGRALSFIYARLLTTGKQSIEQIAKVPVYLDAQGKATNKLTNTYRNATDVLDDVAAVWDKKTNAEKLSIATSVASKRQLTVFMALMQNYDTALKARIESLKAAGSAEKAFGIIQDTLSFKLNQLASSWNNAATSIGDTSAFKNTVMVMTELLNRWAAIINIIQAYKNESKKVSDENQRGIQSEISDLEALDELMKIRQQYLSRPPTDANLKMIKEVEQAMKDLGAADSFFTSEVDVEATSDALKKNIDNLRKQASDNKIDMEVNLDKDVLILEKEKLIKSFDLTAADFKKPRFKKEIKENEDYFKALNRVLEIKEQLKLINSQTEAKKFKARLDIDIAAEKRKTTEEASRAQAAYDNSKELLPIEQEKIDATNNLNMAKQSGLFTESQLLQMELDLLEVYDEAETIHEHELKMETLRAKSSEAKIKDMEKQKSILSSMLNFTGEEESIIIKQEMALKAMQNNELYIKNSMEDRLRLAQALTKEAEEQNKKSSHAVELAKILRKYGPQTAQEISDYQGGAKTFEKLSGTAKEALKKFVPSSFEQEQAAQDITRAGIVTPEAIQKEVTQQRNAQILNQVMIEPIELNVSLNSNEVIEAAKEAIIRELDDKKSSLSEKINSKIENY
jgi:TP901 family phage tail tape measure protein